MRIHLVKLAIATTVVAVTCSVVGLSRAEAAPEQTTQTSASDANQNSASDAKQSQVDPAADAKDAPAGTDQSVVDPAADTAKQTTADAADDTKENGADPADGTVPEQTTQDSAAGTNQDAKTTQEPADTEQTAEKPVATADTATTNMNTRVTIPVLDNDTGQNITLTSVSTPANGTVETGRSCENSPTDARCIPMVVYTPKQDFTGTDSFTYVTTDDQGNTATGNITVTVESAQATDPGPSGTDPADPATTPVATPDTATTSLSDGVSIFVLQNDPDQTVSLTSVTTPANGTAEIGRSCSNSANGGACQPTVWYVPASGFIGTDTFSYTITDSHGNTATSDITVTVLPGPAINPDSAITGQGQPVTIDVLENDTGYNIDIASVSDPDHGTVEVVDKKIIYTPALDFSGTDSFTYSVADSTSDSGVSSNTVTITVVAPPLAKPEAVSIYQGTPTIINVLDNDSGDEVTLTSVSTAAHGTTAINNDGRTIMYSPADSFTGTDTFTYLITDELGQTATSTVTVTVSGISVDTGGTAVSRPGILTSATDYLVSTVAVIETVILGMAHR